MISERRATDVYKMGLGYLKPNSSIRLNQFHCFTSSSKSTTISFQIMSTKAILLIAAAVLSNAMPALDKRDTTTRVSCPAANETLVQDSSKKFYEIQCKIDYPGNDFTWKNVNDFQACVDWCGQTNGCVGVAWVPQRNFPNCYLKSQFSPSLMLHNVESDIIIHLKIECQQASRGLIAGSRIARFIRPSSSPPTRPRQSNAHSPVGTAALYLRESLQCHHPTPLMPSRKTLPTHLSPPPQLPLPDTLRFSRASRAAPSRITTAATTSRTPTIFPSAQPGAPQTTTAKASTSTLSATAPFAQPTMSAPTPPRLRSSSAFSGALRSGLPPPAMLASGRHSSRWPSLPPMVTTRRRCTAQRHKLFIHNFLFLVFFFFYIARICVEWFF